MLINSDGSLDDADQIKDCSQIQREILSFSIPCISTNVFKKLQNTICLMLVGKITMDPAMMAGVGVGNMTKQLLGTTILYGVNNTIETYVS